MGLTSAYAWEADVEKVHQTIEAIEEEFFAIESFRSKNAFIAKDYSFIPSTQKAVTAFNPSTFAVEFYQSDGGGLD